jgi:GxxExxY protein
MNGSKTGEAEQLNRLADAIIGAAIEVHKALGPGMLESAYEVCLAYELTSKGLKVVRQKSLPLTYHGVTLDAGYRLDLMVNDLVIIEVKAVDSLNPVHDAQLLSYLKLTGLHVGLLINFNVKLLKNGIRRLVNNFPVT